MWKVINVNISSKHKVIKEKLRKGKNLLQRWP
jgi:hypothetical protein